MICQQSRPVGLILLNQARKAAQRRHQTEHLHQLEQFETFQEQPLYSDHASSQPETKAAPPKAFRLPKHSGALKFAASLSNYALRQMTILLACSISILADLSIN
jgi:hypothetical protein